MGLAICKEEDQEAKKDDPLERKALEDLYKVFDRDRKWDEECGCNDKNKNWGSSKSIKEWKGVEVDRNHHVVGLTRWNNNSHGPDARIPDSIGNLKYLEELDLRNNNITYIPDSIGNLKYLEGLYLYDNKITYFPWDQIASLKNLQRLYIGKGGNDKLQGNADKLGFIDDLQLPSHIEAPPPINYTTKKLDVRGGDTLITGLKQRFQLITLCLLSAADIVSDIASALQFYYAGHTYIFAAQVVLIVLPGIYMAVSTGKGTQVYEKVTFAMLLGPIIEYVKAMITGEESGTLMEFKVTETLMESCPSGVLQLYYLVKYQDVSNEGFQTVLASLILGNIAAALTMATAIFPKDAEHKKTHSIALQVIHQSSEIIFRMITATMMFVATGAYAFLYLAAAFFVRFEYYYYKRLSHFYKSRLTNTAFKVFICDSIVHPRYNRRSSLRYLKMLFFSVIDAVVAVALFWGLEASTATTRENLGLAFGISGTIKIFLTPSGESNRGGDDIPGPIWDKLIYLFKLISFDSWFETCYEKSVACYKGELQEDIENKKEIVMNRI